jgi:4-hydroxy-2-oxoheptanedioate aldolase
MRLFGAVATLCLIGGVTVTVAQTPKPKRINRAIELLEQGQPIYYTGSHNGTVGTFEQGKQDAQTFADYISYDMEAAPYDIAGLAAYMQGLAAAVPIRGTDEASVRANAWMFEQVLATGVHGILLVHADNPGAVRAMIEAVRYPNREQGVGQAGLKEGVRGAHGASMAAKVWGVSVEEYMRKADPWPLNPNGELLIGVKVEDKVALSNVEETLKVPGIGFGEGGPGDMALSLGVKQGDPKLLAAEERIFAAAKLHKLAWIGITPNHTIDDIKAGYMIGSGEKSAEIGRKFTNRPMPY